MTKFACKKQGAPRYICRNTNKHKNEVKKRYLQMFVNSSCLSHCLYSYCVLHNV